MKKMLAITVAAVSVGLLIPFPSASRAATFPAGRTDPCITAAAWASRAADPSHTDTSLRILASAERACAATFAHQADACPHALKSGDAYKAVGARLGAEEAPGVASTMDYALAFEAYTFAAGVCRGGALSLAVRGAEKAARHVKSDAAMRR